MWKEYTERNPHTPEETDALHLKYYGVTRTQMQQEFLGDLPRDISILEVGCGSGTNIQLLKQVGFHMVHGIDSDKGAVQVCRDKNLWVSDGSAASLDFSDGYFDLVFTSGLLIHIPPEDLPQVMSEIVRVSKRYVWGLEYYSPELVEIPYHPPLQCWKGNYATMFEEMGLKRILMHRYPYLDKPENVDEMYLMEK